MHNPHIRSSPQPGCALCGTAGTLLYESLPDRLGTAPGLWILKQCPNSTCGLVWLDPMPLPEDLGLAYAGYYTHETQQEQTRQERGINAWLRRGFRSVKDLLAVAIGTKAEQFQFDHFYLQDDPPGRVLDIGCGSGQLLARLQQRGWQAEGIDFDPQAAEYVQKRYGIPVRVGTLDQAHYPEASFEAITLSHVIEHVPDPVGLLQECHRILTPGGQVVMVTPNLNSWGHQTFRRDWLALDPPRHLHLFNPSTVTTLAHEAGFKDVQLKTTFVNAVGVYVASYTLQATQRYQMAQRPRLQHALQSLGWHSWFNLRQDNHALQGEELVLKMRKSAGAV